jgi:hypothetical protein
LEESIMKKLTAIGIVVFFVFLSFVACGGKAGAPAAGSANVEDMLSMFPKEARGLLVVDVHRAMLTEPAQKMIADKDSAPKYQEFIKETGIDPQKDIYFVAGALFGDMDQAKPDGALIINARFNKDTLLAKIKEKGGELKESVYEGITVYEINEPAKPTVAEKPEGTEEPKAEGQEPAVKPEEKAEGQESAPQENPVTPPEISPAPSNPAYGAFLSDSNIVFGSEAGVKAVIDVLKNKKENITKNAELNSLIKQSKKDAMVWAVLAIPAEAAKKMAQQNPMLSSLEGVHSILFSFDYRDKAVQAEIKALNKDEQKNKQIADLLTGLKAMGGMAAAEKPEVGELMNKIIIASGPDFVSVSANIPEELINKLSESAKKVIPEMEKK